jgi:hypothetical protein
LGDVLYTIDAKGVEDMIQEARKVRKDKIELGHNELVDMKPEFAKALEACMNFSGMTFYE